MLFSALLLLPALATGLVSGTRARVCTFIEPAFIGTIDSTQPDTVTHHAPAMASDAEKELFQKPGVTAVYRDMDKTPGNNLSVDTIVEFTKIPTDAWGCQLELRFEPGFVDLILYNDTLINLDVWSATKSVSDGAALTWNNAPRPGYLVGTANGINVPLSGKKSDTWPTFWDTPPQVVVNSMACTEKMTFRIKAPQEVARGGMLFRQQTRPYGGWIMKFNC